MIRKGRMEDWDAICELEKACFNEREAASEEALKERLRVFPDCFWLYEEEGKLLSMVNGCLSDEDHLRDEMYKDAELHDPEGKWMMIFGVATLPSERGKGYAGTLLKAMEEELKEKGKKGAVLTCKDFYAPYYAQFGYVNEGESQSALGGASWFEMRKEF